MALKEQMLQYRAENNVSQKEAARRANITLQTWNQVEMGRQSPSRLTEAKIRKVIGNEGNSQ